MNQASYIARDRLACISQHLTSSYCTTARCSASSIVFPQPTVVHHPKTLAQGDACPPTTKGVLRFYNMRFCPFAHRTKLVLEHKKIPHETVNINLKYKPDWFLRLSPLGLVPVLQLDEFVLPESTATCNWLDEVCPGQGCLTPQDPNRRAWDRVLMENVGKISDTFYALRRSPDLKDKKILSLEKRLLWYEDILVKRGSTFFGGESPAMVDLFIWPHFERLPAIAMLSGESKIEPDSKRMPKLVAWMGSMYTLPAVKATMMDKDSHAHFFASFGTGTPAYDYGLAE